MKILKYLQIPYWIILALVVIGILLSHISYYYPFISDDSLISLRYAYRFIEGHGLTWTDGHPVEGYSNLMWVLLVGLLGFLGVDLIVASRILGIFFISSVVFITSYWYCKKGNNSSIIACSIGILFFVGSGTIAVWAIGGLEQPLIAALLSYSIILYWMAQEHTFNDKKVLIALSFILGVLSVTRPDGPIYTIIFVFSLLFNGLSIREKKFWSTATIITSFPVLFYGGQLVFRLWYYGEWVPNTALVKIAPTSHYLTTGLGYVTDGFIALLPAALLAIFFMVKGLYQVNSRHLFVPVFFIFVTWLSYIVAIGGDIFPAYRHFVPIIVVLTFCIIEGVRIHLERFKLFQSMILVFGVILIVIAASFTQFFNSEYHRAKTERWEWDCRSLALTLKKAFYDDQPLLAVTSAGCLPYWSKFPSLDMLGLNDYYLPRNKPTNFGYGYLGHELGSGEYVLNNEPDLIVFFIGYPPTLRVGRELEEDERFEENYKMVYLSTAYDPEYTAKVWFKKDSEKVGIIHDNGQITIPAYFLNSTQNIHAELMQNQLVVPIQNEDKEKSIILNNLPEEFKITVNGDNSDQVEYTVQQQDNITEIFLTTSSKTPIYLTSISISPE